MFWNREPHVVLLVADSKSAAGLHPSFLRHPGIRLVDSHRRDEALGLAQRLRPRLIIQDFGGEEGEALGFCQSIKSAPETRSIPLILISSSDEPPADGTIGPDVRLGKPIVQSEYFEAVRRFVPLPRRRDLRQIVNLRFTFDDGRVTRQAFSRDLSVYGAFLKTDYTLPSGTHLAVRFRIPGYEQEIRCGAVVRRPGVLAGFAVEFEDISDADIERLQDFIRRSLRRSMFSR